ncbi:MAG: EamA family transporter [Rhizobiales bacterium]|nr:EamA family transporter [Hyphomicrobiales bacterium]
MIDPARQRRQRLIGVALMCGAVALFTFLDTTAKYLGAHMDTVQVVWARYASAFLLALAIFNPLTRPGVMVSRRPALQLTRSLMMLGSTVLNFYALRYLQLDQTLAIFFSTPFVVAALAGPMLGEWIGWRRWTAISIGFLGVVLVVRPGFGGIHPAALLSVAGVFCFALYGVMTRMLARYDSSETQLFYGNLVGVVLMSLVVPFFWTTPISPVIVGLMILMGALGSFGHYLLIAGHRLAPASVLSPFMYTQLIWGIALGYLVFRDIPSGWTLAGAGVVIASGLYLLNRERTLHSVEAAQATSDATGPR